MSDLRRKVLIGFAVLGVLCPLSCCGTGAYFYRAWFGKPAESLTEERRLARDEGLALEPEELKRDPVPPSDNAAGPYRTFFGKVMTELNETPELRGICGKLVTGRPTTPADTALARSALKSLAKPIREMIAATKRPHCDFEYKHNIDERNPEYAQAKAAALILCTEAELRTVSGDFDGAFEVLKATERMGRHIGEEPLVIPMLTRLVIDLYVFDELRLIAKRGRNKPLVLEKALNTARSFGPLPSLKFAFRGEGAEVISALANTLKKNGEDSDGIPLPSSVNEAFLAKTIHYWRRVAQVLPSNDADWQAANRALLKLKREVEEDRSPANLFVSVSLRNHTDLPLSIGRRVARRRVTETGLLLLIERTKTGKFPSKLPDLGELSTDPFDNQPLRYQASKTGFTLYSIDRDGVDNGGKPSQKGSRGDLVWKID